MIAQSYDLAREVRHPRSLRISVDCLVDHVVVAAECDMLQVEDVNPVRATLDLHHRVIMQLDIVRESPRVVGGDRFVDVENGGRHSPGLLETRWSVRIVPLNHERATLKQQKIESDVWEGRKRWTVEVRSTFYELCEVCSIGFLRPILMAWIALRMQICLAKIDIASSGRAKIDPCHVFEQQTLPVGRVQLQSAGVSGVVWVWPSI